MTSVDRRIYDVPVEDIERLRDGASEVRLDHTAFPVVIHTWVGSPTAKLVDAYFDRVTDLGKRDRKYFVITDASVAQRPDASVRRAITQHSERLRDQRERLDMGSVVIVTNAMVRGALTAMQWLDPGMAEVTYVADLDTALARARETLRRNGVPLPDRLR